MHKYLYLTAAVAIAFSVAALAQTPQSIIDIFGGRTSQLQGIIPQLSGQGTGATGGAQGSQNSMFSGPSGSTTINRQRSTTGSNAGKNASASDDALIQQSLIRESRERIEFQDFVVQSTGRDLPLFGANLFMGSPSTFAPVDDIPVTPDYTIGPGDELLIRGWGQIDVDFGAVVNRSGIISIPKVGDVNVSGIKYQDLHGLLKTAFGRVFRNFEIAVTLGKLRSMQIFVVGQAKRPGTYTVSSLSTLVTAIFALGGPSIKGSMRSIQLKRGNKTIVDFDLYDLLAKGEMYKDVALLPGDVIYIPPVGPLVAMNGSVNLPAIYELKRETPLSEVIGWAGGLATTAEGQKVMVDRIDQRRVRNVEDFSIDQPGGLARNLRDGDVVTVFALTNRFDNVVTLRGNVAQPSRHPWRSGMRVKDLIPSKEALISRDFWRARAQIVGIDENIQRIMLQQDALGIRLSVNDLNERQLQVDPGTTFAEAIRLRQIERDAGRILNESGQAAMQQPGLAGPQTPFPVAGQQGSQSGGPVQTVQQLNPRDRRALDPGVDRTRLLNQITPSLKEVNWEYAVIERIKPLDLSTTLIPFNLGKAILEDDRQQNVLLQPGDVVTIFSREDLQVPQGKQTKFVRLEGEVIAPGIYQVEPGESLRQLIVRIGGLSPNAYLFGSEFSRESTRVQQQRNLEEAINRLERDVQRSATARSQNVVTGEDAGTLGVTSTAQQALVARLRQVKATGRIVLELGEDATLADLPDLKLEDGDRFHVPAAPSMVSVFGTVYSENTFLYRREKRISDYLAQAGGPTKDADQSSIYIMRADGSVISKRQYGLLAFGVFDNRRLMPGDSVVVPEELDKTTFLRVFKDVSQVFYQMGLGVAALKILRQ